MPIPWGINLRGLLWLIEISSCLRLPAAAFLGFANLDLLSNLELSFSKSLLFKNTSPLITINSGKSFFNFDGIFLIFNIFSITSSPINPSPLVPADIKFPF